MQLVDQARGGRSPAAAAMELLRRRSVRLLPLWAALASAVSPPPPPVLCYSPPIAPIRAERDVDLDSTLVFVFTCIGFMLPMLGFLTVALMLCFKGWADDIKETRRLSNFLGTAQFHEYNPRKNALLRPMTAMEVYGDTTLELDSAGEPLSCAGERLYPNHVMGGAPSPRVASASLGGGRLQRLWLARGGAGSSSNTKVGERRLQKLAAQRSGYRPAGAPAPASGDPLSPSRPTIADVARQKSASKSQLEPKAEPARATAAPGKGAAKDPASVPLLSPPPGQQEDAGAGALGP